MLEPHPPHHTPNTWRDFFVHIATIVVGLLIAVGLEQTVEAIHHRRERTALIEEMRAEAERNRPVLQSNSSRAEAARQWAEQAIKALSTARGSGGGAVTVTLPAGTVDIEGGQPSRAVWDIAKANGKAALIPDHLAEIYDRQAWEASGESDAVSEVIRWENNLDRLSARLQQPIVGEATLHLSPAEADQLLQLLADSCAAAKNIQFWDASWLGAAEAIADGARSREEIDAAMDRQHRKLRR